MADGPVVTDTSQLIKLVGIGMLDLLPVLYGDIWIPVQVWDEFRAGASPSDPDLSSAPWVRMQTTTIQPALLAERNLGRGEAAAISLAAASSARVLVLDDRRARSLAVAQRLPVVGTLAVLTKAKRQGLLPAVGPIIDRMLAQGRYISPRLRAQVLRDAGEVASSP